MKKNAKVTIPAGFDSSNILNLLTFVAAPEFPEFVLPEDPVEPNEVQKHTVQSELFKRLYSAADWTQAQAIEVAEKHRALHDCGTATVTPADCEEARKKAQLLSLHARILSKLKWLAIRKEFSGEAVNNIGVRADWSIVDTDGGNWNDVVMFPDPEDLMNNIPGRIMAIMNGEFLAPTPLEVETGLDPDDLGHLYGVIEDKRILSLFALDRQIIAYGNEFLKVGDMPLGKLPKAEIEKWLLDQTGREIKRISGVKQSCDQAHRIVEAIFSEAVCDLFPEAKDEPALVVRAGWKAYAAPSLGMASMLDEISGDDEFVPGSSLFGEAILQAARRSHMRARM